MRAFLARQFFSLVIFMLPLPALGIVIPACGTGQDCVASDYLAPYGTVFDTVNLNGVVYINTGGVTCSGALISPTQVLTAAHCLSGLAESTIVNFVDSTNSFDPISGTSVIDPDYDGTFAGGADLAVVNLSSAAPAWATVYQLYSGSIPYGATIAVAGFGDTGNGNTGATTGDGTRMVGENSYDTNGGAWFGSMVSTSLLLADFDNGTPTDNVFGGSGTDSLGVMDEVDINHGDSGGPSFYNGMLIGINDFINCGVVTGCTPNSYYGEVFADVSVAGNTSGIQSAMDPSPEPSSWLLMTALPAIAFLRRKRTRAA